jgi:hypothetical protein
LTHPQSKTFQDSLTGLANPNGKPTSTSTGPANGTYDPTKCCTTKAQYDAQIQGYQDQIDALRAQIAQARAMKAAETSCIKPAKSKKRKSKSCGCQKPKKPSCGCSSDSTAIVPYQGGGAMTPWGLPPWYGR